MSLTGTTPEDFLGNIVGGYRLARVLGTGSTGIVFLGEHPENLTETVAVKICLPPIQFTPEEREIFQARFLREAEVVQRLSHPHIVPVLQRGAENGILYTIFRYMQRGTLADKLAHYPQGMAFGEVINITTQIAAALDVAHQAGVVHRDIKPTNIFFDRPEIFAQQEQFSHYDDAYLGDFGIVYLLDQTRVTLTALGQVLGTPGYMSPEQANGAVVTPATDIYSLGIVVFEMITGRLPFEATQTLQLLLQIVQTPPPLPRHLRADLPEAAEAAVLQAIAKVPTLRFTSAGEFAMALAQGMSAPPFAGDIHSDSAVLGALPMLDKTAAAAANNATNPSDTANTGALAAPLFPRTGPLPAPPVLSFADGKPSPIPRPEPALKPKAVAFQQQQQWWRAYLSRENILVFVGTVLVTIIGIVVLLGHRNGASAQVGSASSTATTSATAATTAGIATAPTPGQTVSATTVTVAPGATQPTKPGSSAPPPAHGQPTATPVPAPQPTLLYDFENGQVWQTLGLQITGVAISTDQAFAGSHSLEVKFAGLTPTTYPEAFGNQAIKIPTNATLVEEVYLPAGIGGIKALAFVIVQNGTFYKNDYVDLTAGGWTTLRYPLPSAAFNQTAVNIGVQFFASSSTINGSIYIDHVEFAPS